MAPGDAGDQAALGCPRCLPPLPGEAQDDPVGKPQPGPADDVRLGDRGRARRRFPAALIVLALALALALAGAACTGQATGSPPAASASSTSVTGTVTAAGKPLDSADVTLYAGSSAGVTPLGHATTGTGGRFSIAYAAPASCTRPLTAVRRRVRCGCWRWWACSPAAVWRRGHSAR